MKRLTRAQLLTVLELIDQRLRRVEEFVSKSQRLFARIAYEQTKPNNSAAPHGNRVKQRNKNRKLT